MVNMIRKDGAYLIEIKVQSKKEKELVEELEKLNRDGKSEEEYWGFGETEKAPSLDDGWKPDTEDTYNPFKNQSPYERV